MFKFLFFSLSLFLSFSALTQVTKADQLAALETYLQEQKVSNGGINVKKEYFDLTIDGLRKKYSKLIKDAMTLEEFEGYHEKIKRSVLPEEEFEQLMIGLTAEFQDGHHNTMRQSGGHWDLGLKTAAIQGKLYITGFNKFYTPGRFGEALMVGDEIIELGGKNILDLKNEFLLYTRMFSGTYEMQEAMALESTVSRSGRYLRAVREGDSVSMTIKRQTSNGEKILDGELVWMDASKVSKDIQFYAGLNPRAPKGYHETPYYYGMMSQKKSQFRVGVENLNLPNGAITEIGDNVNLDILRELQKVPEMYRDQLPVAPVERLQAYTVFINESNKAGVIRIPSYSPNGGFLEVIREFNWISEVIDRMNHSGVTHFMIDANSNGGGYVAYVSHLMRLFAVHDDIKTGSANVKLTKTYLNMLEEASTEGIDAFLMDEFGADVKNNVGTTIEKINALPEMASNQINLNDYFNVVKSTFADKNALRILYERLSQKYKNGERWSGQLPYMGVNNGITEGSSGRSARILNPVFNKPVIFLNDIRSASGGDYGPAVLMANEAALVFGDTSRGLGMPVYRNQPSLPGSELYTRNPYAFSLLPNGLPLENIGPVPNIRREIFYEDLMTGFTQYAIDAVNTGFYYSKGATKEQIQAFIDNNVEKLIVGGELPEETKVLKRYFEILSHGEVKTIETLTEKNAQRLIEIYTRFDEVLKLQFVKAYQAKRADVFKKYIDFIKLPLPEALIKEDIILASVYRSRSVIDRLNFLESSSKFKSKPKAQELIKFLSNMYKDMGNISTMNDCNTLFKALPNFKTK